MQLMRQHSRVRWHLTRGKEDQAVASNQVEAAATSLTTQKENKLVLGRVIEVLDQLLPLGDACAAVQPHKGILQEDVLSAIGKHTAWHSTAQQSWRSPM